MKMNEIRNLSQEELSKQFSALSKDLRIWKWRTVLPP